MTSQVPGARVTIDVHPSAAETTAAAAERLVLEAASAIAATDRWVIALSGGSTPRSLYQLLATPAYAKRIDWSKVHVFWGDERCVPPDDPSSNWRMAREALLDLVPIPSTHVHRIHGEDDPTRAAVDYERELTALFAGAMPRFDVVLLGLGDDGHTASLFPGLSAVREARRLVTAEYVAKMGMWRVSLAPPAINAASVVLFLVIGSNKAETLRQVLEGSHDPARWPAQIVAPAEGSVTWLVDTEAAASLSKAGRRPNVEGGRWMMEGGRWKVDDG